MLTFALLFTLDALIAATLLRLRKIMHPVVLAYGYLTAVILFDQTYTVVNYNLGLIDSPPDMLAFVGVRLYAFIVYPFLFLWLSACLFRHIPPLRQAAIVLIYIGLATLYDYVLVWAGYVELIRWTLALSIIRHIVFIAILIPAMLGFRRWLESRESAL